MKPSDLEYMVAYQIGALQAMAAYSNAKVTHLKPHGALNNMAAENKDYALAIGRAIKAVDQEHHLCRPCRVGHGKGRTRTRPDGRGEGFCDRQYDDDGNLTSRKISGSVLQDPEIATKQVIEMVVNKTIVSRNGKRFRAMSTFAVRSRRRADRCCRCNRGAQRA